MKKFLVLIVVLSSITGTTYSNIRFASIFGDRMVLQRQVDVPIWGTAEKGEKIALTFAEQTVFTTADDGGKWMAHLAPM
jgi:sialate O-acetylesterase